MFVNGKNDDEDCTKTLIKYFKKVGSNQTDLKWKQILEEQRF